VQCDNQSQLKPSAEAPAQAIPAEKDPDETAGAADDDLENECFMYLERHPQLVELDPGLTTYCSTNPAAARDIIGALLEEMGL
jgi:hypothetical protein